MVQLQAPANLNSYCCAHQVGYWCAYGFSWTEKTADNNKAQANLSIPEIHHMGVSVRVTRIYTQSLWQRWYRPMKILILDDHTLFREGMKLLLTGLHPELIIHDAETMQAALASVEANTYDLVLSAA